MAKGSLHGNGDVMCSQNTGKCPEFGCFFCTLKEQNPAKRRAGIAKYLKEMHCKSEEGQVLVMSGLWNMAMTQPNDPEFLKLGILECMASLIRKGLKDRKWLLRDQNVYIPYYAAHIIGSYTMNVEEFAEMAVEAGAIPPLVELLRGRLTWVEQRVAVRALGHLATYKTTFAAVSAHEEIVELAMEVSSGCLETVYTEFMQWPGRRLRYHCDLLTRGLGGIDMENRKAEEWASQLQCWSLHLLNCFAYKEKFVPVICRPGFLKKLPGMWGGLVNENSPAGVGLLRILCYHTAGRSFIAECPEIIDSLSNVSRSSDDWQHMAIQCLLLLLQDPHTRTKVIDKAAVALVDLAEIQSLGDRKRVGEAITEVLLQTPASNSSTKFRARQALSDLRSLRQRIKWEKSMCKEDLRVKRAAALVVKLEGNSKFSDGDLKGAVAKYTEALALCPLKARRERLVLFSNRAQCHLLLQHPDSAISDTTRALSISNPVNCHGKSLWRRAQAYDMKGLAKESLLDAIMFINECSPEPDHQFPSVNSHKQNRYIKVPHYAAHMVRKQMHSAWLFADAARRHGKMSFCGYLQEEEDDDDEEEELEIENRDGEDESEWETVSEGNEDDTVKHIPPPSTATSAKPHPVQYNCSRQQPSSSAPASSRAGGGVHHNALDSTIPPAATAANVPQSQTNAQCMVLLPTIEEESLSEIDKSEKKKKKNHHLNNNHHRIESAAAKNILRAQRNKHHATCNA